MLGVCCWHFLRGHEVELFRQRGEAGADRRGARDPAAAGGRQPLRGGGHERAEHEDRRLRGAVEHLPAVRLLALPDRRLLRAATRRRASRSRSRGSSRTWPPARSTARCRASTSSRAGAAQVRPRQLHAERRVDVLVDAGDGLRGRADVPGRRRRGVALPGAGSSARAGSCGRRSSRSRFPYIAATAGWILTEMGRQPWIVQGPAADQRRELAERQHDVARRSASASSSPSTSSSASSTSC